MQHHGPYYHMAECLTKYALRTLKNKVSLPQANDQTVLVMRSEEIQALNEPSDIPYGNAAAKSYCNLRS